ncbi:UDP-glucose dehydrogenase family protein [Marinicrinis lubricantis]|uniref:UDP-glucose 6-dehydrogenase n=1 Tax=Marinicrinis lubricantis TaxID=2086470 RepID=A0ABW1IJW8_9BACL
MNIAVIGTGYVGLVSGVCYAELGNHVICVDKEKDKIRVLQEGGIPIYEPGLKQLADHNRELGRLQFTFDTLEAVRQSDVVIIAVGTPPGPRGEADLQYIEAAAREIGDAMNGYKVVVVKSTVPVGTNEKVQQIVRSRTDQVFDIASVPEFLREGSAVRDTLYPDRIVIGAESPQAVELLKQLHQSLTPEIIVTDIRSAEMIKYASNAFLATKISFINEIANICEKVGADVTEVATGMGLDHRIGPHFLQAGIGYGGSCFPKDTKALIQIAGNADYDFKLLKSVVEVNRQQRFGIIDKLIATIGPMQRMEGKKVGVWGLAFKPDTDDVREAPALDIVQTLIEHGAIPKVYDPVAMDNFRSVLDHPSIHWCRSALEAAEEAEAICLLTEWKEFKQTDFKAVEQVMLRPLLIDGRNIFGPQHFKDTQFLYYSVGRPAFGQGHGAMQTLMG